MVEKIISPKLSTYYSTSKQEFFKWLFSTYSTKKPPENKSLHYSLVWDGVTVKLTTTDFYIHKIWD